MPEETPAPASDPNSALALLQFITQHFLVISAAAVMAAYLCATIFLYAYLSFFDWRLIWIIESGDVLKAGLVALAVISTFITFVHAVAFDADSFSRGEKRTKPIILAVLLGTIASASSTLWLDQGVFAGAHFGLLIMLHVSWFALFISAVAIARSIRKPAKYTIADGIGDLALVIGTCLVLGFTFGYWVRDTAGFKYDVTVKGEQLQGLGLVMITTHHSIFFADEKAVVVPTSDVSRIQGRTR